MKEILSKMILVGGFLIEFQIDLMKGSSKERKDKFSDANTLDVKKSQEKLSKE
jgi:hypothetical protein